VKRTFVAPWSMTKYCDLRKSHAPERTGLHRFGDGRNRERVLGGPTRAFLRDAKLPLRMTHSANEAAGSYARARAPRSRLRSHFTR